MGIFYPLWYCNANVYHRMLYYTNVYHETDVVDNCLRQTVLANHIKQHKVQSLGKSHCTLKGLFKSFNFYMFYCG